MKTDLMSPWDLFIQPIRYLIPDFQRRYVWKREEQWEPLWQDLETLAQSSVEPEHARQEITADSHFMGAIVLQRLPFAPKPLVEQRIVVDGQQRLTTLQLLIDAIQEVLEDRGYSDPAERLAVLAANGKPFVNKPDHAFKVWPTIIDRVPFRHAMSSDLSATEWTGSRIVQAHTYFRNQAEQWLDKFPQESGEEAARALERAVSKDLQVVVIALDDSDDPHVIFETLNARGTPLLQSDMIKNKILHDAGVEQQDENDCGASIVHRNKLWPFQDDWWAKDIGRGLQRRPRVDVYLNHWLTLRNRTVMKPYAEFSAFKKYADAEAERGYTIRSVADDLGDIGTVYREVEENQREDIKQFIERRNVMNVHVVTPLLLWLLSAGLSSATLENCLKTVESFLVRRVICGYSARGYGRLFARLIARLSEESADTDVVIVSYLRDQTAQGALWPSDEELLDRFKTAPLYWHLTRGRLRMVLGAIEGQLRRTKHMTEPLEVKTARLHIEHIMPQAWRGKHWPLPDDLGRDEAAVTNRDRIVHTIGNLTLVTGPLNSSLSNGPWDKKRKALDDHSVLCLNEQLVKHGPAIWNETAIEERAETLHEQAVKVWPAGDKIMAGR